MGENVNYVYVIVTSDFAGLNDTSHLSAQACILSRSAFSASAALIETAFTRSLRYTSL